MDEKKVREAIEVIKGYRRLDEYMNNTRRLPYCDMAIEALEKQLSVKPEHIVINHGKTHSWKRDKDGKVDMEAFEDNYYGYCAECEKCGISEWDEEKLNSEELGECIEDYYVCPVCGARVNNLRNRVYCDCGKKFDWSWNKE